MASTFDVSLTAKPDTDVVLSVTSADTGEVTATNADDDSENNNLFTFTSENWNTPQTVTLTGVNDNIIDGSINTTITISVVDASSNNKFHSVADQFVTVTTTDDDVAGFTLSKTTATVTEAGSTDTFTVRLDAEPTSNVEFSVTVNKVEVTVDKESLTFTPATGIHTNRNSGLL